MSISLRRRPVRAVLLIIALLAAFGTATALAASRTVKVEDNFYSTKKLSISRGTSVTWKWTGALYHDVKVKTGPAKFASHKLLHGSFAHHFTARGTYKLYCTLHKEMTMTVVVH